MLKHPLVIWIRKRPLLVLLTFFLIADVVLAISYVRHEHRVLTVAFLDIGQGDAVYIETPNGNQLLYDAGPPTGAVLRELSKVMPWWDRSIDVAVLSHPDQDHIGGFLDVFNRYKVDLVLESGASSTNGVYEEEEKSIASHHIARIVSRRGMTIELGGGVRADILYPDTDTSDMETNAASIVLRLSYGSTSVMLSGDLPIKEEEHLVALDGNELQANILKLGHHGSKTSSSEAWLRAVAPDVAIISAGLNNKYGHPHKEVLAILGRLKIPSLITFNEGTITFWSDGYRFVRK